MKIIPSAFLLIVLFSYKNPSTSQAPFNNKAYIRDKAVRMTNALLAQNIDTLLYYQHPAFVAMLGNIDEGKMLIKKQWEKMKQDGTEYKKIDVGLPTQIIEDNGLLECLLPETFKIKMKEKLTLVPSTLIGISMDKGQRWYFIDAAKPNLAKIKETFPFISKKLNFPTLPDAKIIKE